MVGRIGPIHVVINPFVVQHLQVSKVKNPVDTLSALDAVPEPMRIAVANSASELVGAIGAVLGGILSVAFGYVALGAERVGGWLLAAGQRLRGEMRRPRPDRAAVLGTWFDPGP